MNKYMLSFLAFFFLSSINISFSQEFDLENYKKRIASYNGLRLNTESISVKIANITNEELGNKLHAIATEKISRGIENSGVYLELGQAYYYLSQYSKAIPTLTEALTYGSNEEIIFRFRGMSKVELEDYRGALLDFNESINMHEKPTDDLYFYRGFANYFLGNLQSALTDFTKAIEINSTQGTYYFYRGAVYIDMEQKEKGCLDLSTAGEYGYSRAYEFIKDYCNN